MSMVNKNFNKITVIETIVTVPLQQNDGDSITILHYYHYDSTIRKLNTFLKAKDGDKVLGNLYKTVTDEGHVKWVCIDHCRENYQKSTAKDFQRVLDSVGGSFDKNIGRVAVKLRSRVMAEQFFSALGKARSVYELDIDFDWACTTSDLELLEGALKISTRVSILRLDLRLFQLSFEARSTSKQFTALAEVLKTNNTLTTLDLSYNSIGPNGAQALAEALKINTLTTLDLQSNSIGDNGTQALAEALKTNNTLTTLDLYNNEIGPYGAQALAEALKINSTITIKGI
ncbi:hypothetical protein EC991_002993 [Linnemannia zychae]|nr:hypothetical protein EC991_002993 [Linnemannia zychae]